MEWFSDLIMATIFKTVCCVDVSTLPDDPQAVLQRAIMKGLEALR